MTEQIVSFETAKLAKEKRFNEFSRSAYDKSGNVLMFQGGQEEMRNSGDYYMVDKVCTAPTQSLLQKWLREKHLLCPIILPTIDFKHWTLNYDIYKFYNTYEEALEDGLYVALNLIK